MDSSLNVDIEAVSPDDHSVQGHTAGSICIMFQSKKEAALFSGDHIAYSSSRKALHGFKRYNHGNVDVQQESLYALSSDDLPYQCELLSDGIDIDSNAIHYLMNRQGFCRAMVG